MTACTQVLGTVPPGPCPPKPRFHATWVLPYNLLRSQKSRPTPVPRAVLSDQDALPRWDANAVWDLQTTVHFYLAPTSTLIAARALPQIARHRILFASVLFNREKVVVRPFDDPSVHSPCTAVGSLCSLEREESLQRWKPSTFLFETEKQKRLKKKTNR